MGLLVENYITQDSAKKSPPIRELTWIGIAGNAHKNVISVYAVGENKPFELTRGDLVRRLIFTFCYDFDWFLFGAMPKSMKIYILPNKQTEVAQSERVAHNIRTPTAVTDIQCMKHIKLNIHIYMHFR